MKHLFKVLLMAIPLYATASDFDARYFYDHFSGYIVTPVNLMEMKHSFVEDQLREISKKSDKIVMQKVGESCEGRSINMLSFGQGDSRLLLWSQMHGDEPTATAALLSVFNYFAAESSSPFVQELYKNISIHAVIMLNPDGAERFERRNSQGIDINRDAQRLISPEARALKRIKDEINPEFGFNLHDMGGRETVGKSGKILSLALMAPPFDKQNSDNPSRTQAKKLAVLLKNTADQFIESHVARYKADYMPRAFGDAFQNWQVSTVLIESGLPTSEEPHFLVRINFVVLMSAFDAVSKGRLDNIDPGLYDQIPLEGIEVYDILLKNVLIYNGRKIPPFRDDVGINIDYKWKDNRTVGNGVIADIGDLYVTSGRKEIVGDDLIVTPGLIARVDDNHDQNQFLKWGITTMVSGDSDPKLQHLKNIPDKKWLAVDQLTEYTGQAAEILHLDKKGLLLKEYNADLLIFEGNDPHKLYFENLRYVIQNGRIVFKAD